MAGASARDATAATSPVSLSGLGIFSAKGWFRDNAQIK
jgi:hypothetical protein